MPTPRILIAESEVDFSAIRAQGAGGQNVNKVSNAVHLRFDIAASSLPPDIQQRLRALPDRRISQDGVVVVKAQTQRSLAYNKAAALARLQDLVDAVTPAPVVRKATRPSRSARAQRMDEKSGRSEVKTLRRRVQEAD